MARRHVYREIRYAVGMRTDSYGDFIDFFPTVLMDGDMVGEKPSHETWTAPTDDPKLMSLAYGAVQALCDQENSLLQDRGLNRVREVR